MLTQVEDFGSEKLEFSVPSVIPENHVDVIRQSVTGARKPSD